MGTPASSSVQNSVDSGATSAPEHAQPDFGEETDTDFFRIHTDSSEAAETAPGLSDSESSEGDGMPELFISSKPLQQPLPPPHAHTSARRVALLRSALSTTTRWSWPSVRRVFDEEVGAIIIAAVTHVEYIAAAFRHLCPIKQVEELLGLSEDVEDVLYETMRLVSTVPEKIWLRMSSRRAAPEPLPDRYYTLAAIAEAALQAQYSFSKIQTYNENDTNFTWVISQQVMAQVQEQAELADSMGQRASR